MTFQDNKDQLTQTHIFVRFTAVCRRFKSMAAVLHDATRPWLQGARAKDLIESSESSADAIREICFNLASDLSAAQMTLGIKSDSLSQFHSSGPTTDQEVQVPVKWKLYERSQMLFSLVCDGARETADLIRSFWDSPARWCSSPALENDGKHLATVVLALDYTRWQILKELAKLVAIFDDHEDRDSDEPCEAWRMDQSAMGNA